MTGDVLPGVPVTLTFKFPTEPAGPASTLLTDPRGVAVFSGLAAGSYVPSFGKGYRPSTTISYLLIDSGDRKRLELSVRRVATVSVRVLDWNGRPIKDALVRLLAITYL